MFPNDRWLMCAPAFFDVNYEINPWMKLGHRPLRPRAAKQWQTLHHTILRLGGWVEYLDPSTEQPDLVFTANGGLVLGKRVVLSNFWHPERQGEAKHFRAWFEREGFEILETGKHRFEGEGDALFAGSTLFGGWGYRSDREAYDVIAEKLQLKKVVSCKLVDPYFYHLDTCFSPITPQNAIFVRSAFDPASLKEMEQAINLIEVPLEEAKKFACNAVILGKSVITPAGCPQTAEILARLGYQAHQVELDEFMKAGGAAKCLTLCLTRV